MTDPFRKALHWIDTSPNAPKHYTKAGNEINRETIRKALRIASRLQQEPSEAMVNRSEHLDFIYHRTTDNPGAVFKAMTQQLMKECEE